MFRAFILISVCMLSGAHTATSVAAEKFAWKFRSDYPKNIRLKFFSKDNERTWPAGNNVYVMRGGKTYSIRLDCTPGELVCYGAWVADTKSIYWGVGPGNARECTNCCMVCGEDAALIRFAD